MKTISTGGPMLASNEVITDFDRVQYPVVVSSKLDGWRCYHNDGPRTRAGFILPNLHTRAQLMSEELIGLDGELISGSPTDPNSMQKAQSAFSSIEGEPDFTWYVFDDWRRSDEAYFSFWTRNIFARKLPSFVEVLPQQLVSSSQELEDFSKYCTDAGYEGAIIRAQHSQYKYGRSTTKQGWMLKVKPYSYDEGVIVSLNEKLINANELEQDNFGYAKRSHAKAGKVPAGTLGSFTIRDKQANTFNISCGHLDDIAKQLLWNQRENYIGRVITYKHFAQSGIRNKPRHGQFVSFRAEVDL